MEVWESCHHGYVKAYPDRLQWALWEGGKNLRWKAPSSGYSQVVPLMGHVLGTEPQAGSLAVCMSMGVAVWADSAPQSEPPLTEQFRYLTWKAEEGKAGLGTGSHSRKT